MANIFKLDEPIGRKQFIITLGVLLFYTVFATIISICARYFFDINQITAIAITVFALLSLLILIYINWVNYVKRVWDLIQDKQKAIFYVSAWFVANIAMSCIPVLRYVSVVISVVILGICLLLPKLPEITDEKDSTQE